MALIFKTNAEKIAKRLREYLNKKPEDLEKAFVKGMYDFNAYITKDQLSGRKSVNYGLNVITGTLRRSFRIRKEGSFGSGRTLSVIMGTNSKYGPIHQYGGAAGRNHASIIPKRLYILEDFKVRGKDLLLSAISKKLYGGQK